jgi:hypothetical protein
MKTRILASIITGVLVTSAAQAETVFSTNDLDSIYSGLNTSFTRNVDISGYYKALPQLQQAAASNLVTSVAQADSISPLDVIYSGLNPSFTRNVDVTGYYTVPAQLQQVEHKSACNWSVVKNDLNLLKAAYAVAGNTEYFAPANLQLVC